MSSENQETQVAAPPPLTLYSLTGDLVDLVTLQAEMIANGEDTADIDREIQAYVGERIPERVDAAAHVSKSLQAQARLAEEEEKRLRARKQSFLNARERLHGYLAAVLERLPMPKRGSRRLEGRTSTVALYGNGGEQTLDFKEELLPAEYFTYKIELSHSEYLQARELLGTPAVKNAERVPDTRLIREHLGLPCAACQGGRYKRPDAPCASCGDSGFMGVPGAQLLPRGSHIRIL